MGKFLIYLFIFFTIQKTFSQEAIKQQYKLNGSVDKKENYKLDFDFNFLLIEEGKVIITIPQHVYVGVLKDFGILYSIKDTHSKNKIKRKYIKDTSEMKALVEGNPVENKKNSVFEGETIVYKRSKDKIWFIPKFDNYDSIQQEKLEEYLSDINTIIPRKDVKLVYLNSMNIGQTIELTNDNVIHFFDVENFKIRSGTLTLKEILVSKKETIAVFTMDIDMQGTFNFGKDAINLKMNGTLKRSLTKFYDKEVTLTGTATIESIAKDYKIIIPAKLSILRNLH